MVTVTGAALKKIPFLILLLFMSQPGAHADMNSQPLNCELSVATPQQLTEGVQVDFYLHNNLEHEIVLLNWYTPFEGFLSDLFIVTDSTGKQLDYQGAMVKRLSPESEDYINIPATQKISVQLDLTQGYLLSQGKFSIQLKPRTFQYKIAGSQLINFDCNVEDTTVFID